MINRRKFISSSSRNAAALALCMPALSSRVFAQESRNGASAELVAQPLGNDLTLISGAGCNVLVKKAGNGDLLVVDGGLQHNAEKLLALITAETSSSRISTLVNTHWHREQTGLNEAVGAAGGRIFGHENTRLWLSVEIQRPWEETPFAPLPEIARPNETFYHYGDLNHGTETLLYGYMRQAHTDGDAYVYFPEENVIHAGGVISNEGWPIIDWWTGGWIGGLVDGLEIIIKASNEATRIIPANGPVMSYAELLTMRDMYATIFERIRNLFMKAQGPQETLAAKPTAEFDAQWGNSDLFVLLAHQSVLAHYAPDA
ncbi:MAG: MBL fold metallo-hydrolase [Pseudomonadales bacterium]|nr:MBL fold metallo-hydrolase [Pseudomonadales bacterium]